MEIKVSTIGVLESTPLSTETEIVEVEIITKGGVRFQFSERDGHIIGIRTRSGSLVIEPIASNYVEIMQRGF